MKMIRATCVLTLLIFLNACATESPATSSKLVTARHDVIVRNGIHVPPSPAALNEIAPAAGTVAADAVGYDENPKTAKRCGLRDRFDRKQVIAYNFEDGRSRVGLNLRAAGFGLSDLGRVEVEKIQLNFRYRFPPHKKKQSKCLYDSGWQGLAGSAYNEFFLREDDTVYEALDDEWDRVEDELSKFF